LKDLRLVLEAADESQTPMPLASLVRDHLQSGVARGYAEMDWAALARVIAEDAGLAS
jgi:3-hydroxyisobutyrate dehydrogenase-like beta-hydroxyacid dehydrogenase